MTINTTGIPLNVTKDPQCRHSEHQGFVSYTSQVVGGHTGWKATCSNCASFTDFYTQRYEGPDWILEAKEAARDALMRIEAPPLVP